MRTVPSRSPIRRAAVALWRIALIVALFLWLHPVSYRSTRAATVALLLMVWAGALALWWRSKAVRVIGLGLAAALALALVLPGRAFDVDRLRTDYVKALKVYEGTRYVWGGENRLGIDCSGLVRRGLIDASLREGLSTANPALLRMSMTLRWHDCTARALRDGYRSYTRQLFPAPNIWQLDHRNLLPGDFAVTADGVHTLAYLGDETWIEADPGAGRVLMLKASADNGWLNVPVDIVRWRVLESPAPLPTPP